MNLCVNKTLYYGLFLKLCGFSVYLGRQNILFVKRIINLISLQYNININIYIYLIGMHN
jgi:hypothetical protein